MDDRQSVYLDTISLASDYPNRKSLSQSRQTIYHSAEDVNSSSEYGSSTPIRHSNSYNTYDKSRAKVYKNKTSSVADAAVGVSTDDLDMHNSTELGTSSGLYDEVSARLLLYKKNKKMAITYSQWKSRVTIQ